MDQAVWPYFLDGSLQEEEEDEGQMQGGVDKKEERKERRGVTYKEGVKRDSQIFAITKC